MWFDLLPTEIAALRLFSGGLRSIFFEAKPGLLRVFATNGYAFLAINIPSERFGELQFVKGKIPISCFASLKIKDIAAHISVSKEGGGVVACFPKQGDPERVKFAATESRNVPPVETITPDKVTLLSAQFDPSDVYLFVRAGKLLGPRDWTPYSIRIGFNGLKPALVSLGFDYRAFGLLMPLQVRQDEFPQAPPTWFFSESRRDRKKKGEIDD